MKKLRTSDILKHPTRVMKRYPTTEQFEQLKRYCERYSDIKVETVGRDVYKSMHLFWIAREMLNQYARKDVVVDALEYEFE